MKTMGCISTEQLMRFRNLSGVDVNGTLYPMHDVFRPIQEHNYTERPVYECGEMRQDPMVGTCSHSDGDDEELMWFIIGIVFIVLLNADCCNVTAGSPSRKGGYHSA